MTDADADIAAHGLRVLRVVLGIDSPVPSRQS